jgi:DNA invertase Pin-like site-specific DNA recombinase
LKFGGTATKAYPHHTPPGKAMYQILGVFAEFERAIIIERVKSGLARARSQGKRNCDLRDGGFYQFGKGVPEDLAQARVWMKKAAAMGDIGANMWLRDHP